MPSESHNSILIIGPGAIGLFFAVRLSQAGLRIALLDHRPDRARRTGEITLHAGSKIHSATVTCSADPRSVAQYDQILICVKAHQTHAVAHAIVSHIKPSTSVLSLQNGLGNKAALAILPCQQHTRLGITSYGAYLRQENAVEAAGEGIIQLAGPPNDPICRRWQQYFTAAKLNAEIVPDFQKSIWTKLVLNAAINPVTARFGLRNGELPKTPEAWQLASVLLEESITVARATGISIDISSMQKTLADICQATAANYSSMFVDILAGKETEIDAINGAIVRAGKKVGIATPHNDSIIKQIAARSPHMPTTILS